MERFWQICLLGRDAIARDRCEIECLQADCRAVDRLRESVEPGTDRQNLSPGYLEVSL